MNPYDTPASSNAFTVVPAHASAHDETITT